MIISSAANQHLRLRPSVMDAVDTLIMRHSILNLIL